MRLVLFALAVGSVLAGCAPTQAPAPVALVKKYPVFGCCTYAAVVERAKLTSSRDLTAVGKYVCQSVSTNTCAVRVYLTSRDAPAEGASADATVALGKPDFVYNLNHATGLDQSMWNCTTFNNDGYTSDQCMG